MWLVIVSWKFQAPMVLSDPNSIAAAICDAYSPNLNARKSRKNADVRGSHGSICLHMHFVIKLIRRFHASTDYLELLGSKWLCCLWHLLCHHTDVSLQLEDRHVILHFWPYEKQSSWNDCTTQKETNQSNRIKHMVFCDSRLLRVKNCLHGVGTCSERKSERKSANPR